MKSIRTLIRENSALSLAFFAVFVFCVGIYLYTRWDTARFEASLQTPPPKTHGTELQAPQDGQAGLFHPDGNPFHAEPHAAEETSEQPTGIPHTAPPDTSAKTPPDDYHGDPLYRIEGMQYETLITTSNEGYISSPVIPPEKLNRIYDVYDLPYREETKHLTREQLHQLAVEILVEGLSALDPAKFLVAYGFYEKYAGEYAQQALAENPNDFNTLYV